MKRNAIGLDEVAGAWDFIRLDFDGVQHEGMGGWHSEWPIHAAALLARPARRFVARMTSSALRSFPAPDFPALAFRAPALQSPVF